MSTSSNPSYKLHWARFHGPMHGMRLKAQMSNGLIVDLKPRLEIAIFYPKDPDTAFEDISFRLGEWRLYPHHIPVETELMHILIAATGYTHNQLFPIELPIA